ncbi:cell division protein FtsL [Marinagarivorans cellulosilyticus]|uniref:Cell division protein FtsL n=1 Tax=Marinagarivorans cellulosilyticus TaxID=2721545 RepID=A0AAN2BK82_9GAMM|nr:cell division protein FtsL [Marinagarivorans cellulosilyticus]BCD97803.1 cell division protein FtsL [Marinagarivorans cellulosilyticus]
MVISKSKLSLVGILWVGVVVSAISVVYITFDVRRHTQALAVLNNQTQTLQVETGQLLLEKSALASYARVEKIATQELSMRVPTGHEVVVVETR